MFKSMRKAYPLFNIINGSLIHMPIHSSISIMLNFGSLIKISLIHFNSNGPFSIHTPDIEMAFSSTIHICRDVNYG